MSAFARSWDPIRTMPEMESIVLVREVDGFQKEAWVDVWEDGDTGLHHPRITYEAWPANELHFEDGVKSFRAAEKTARELAKKLRTEGWKDELTREEQARVDARVAEREAEERAAEKRIQERIEAFPVSAIDQTLAKAIASPAGVTELDLRGSEGNRISVVPPDIKKLKELQVLHLEGNALDALPEELGKLNALRALHLAHNRLKDLPRGVWFLRKLVILDIHDNVLPEIYEFLGDYQKKGLELQIAGNPIAGFFGPTDKMATLAIDTASLFPIGDRVEDPEPGLTAIHLYGAAPTEAQTKELSRCFPNAKVEVFARIEDGPRIVTVLGPVDAPKPKKAARKKK